jgi:hypothetical protein
MSKSTGVYREKPSAVVPAFTARIHRVRSDYIAARLPDTVSVTLCSAYIVAAALLEVADAVRALASTRARNAASASGTAGADDESPWFTGKGG